MSAAHTPGPWTMETVRTSCGVCFKVGPFPWKNGKLNHACIYADYPSPGGPEYKAAVANATLIAAAPAMLQALERLSAAALARDNVMGDPCALLAAKAELADANRAACAVIAQARGQS